MGVGKSARTLPSNACADCLGVINLYNYDRRTEQLERLIVGFARSALVKITVTSRLRSCCEQSALAGRGRSAAPPSTSQHEFGFAFDLVPQGFERYGSFGQAVAWLVELAEVYGGHGLAEHDHAHIQLWDATTWGRLLATRDIGLSIPIPGRRRRS